MAFALIRYFRLKVSRPLGIEKWLETLLAARLSVSPGWRSVSNNLNREGTERFLSMAGRAFVFPDCEYYVNVGGISVTFIVAVSSNK